METDFKDPERITEAMKGGLARLYADQDFREYLLHAVNINNHNVLIALKADKPEIAKEYAVRLDTLKKLLEKGKLMYTQSEKLQSKSLADQLKEHEEAKNVSI